MPLYDYACRQCGFKQEEYFRITSESVPLACPRCCAEGTYTRQVSLPHTDLKEFHKPIEMLSIAMEDPDEIKAFVQRTGVDCSIDPQDPNYGVPIARNRSQKRKALAEAGFEERR